MAGASSPSSLAELRDWLERLPAGTMFEVSAFLGWLASIDEGETTEAEDDPPLAQVALSWKERLWIVPAETRLAAEEVAEALGRSKSWVYNHTYSGAANPLPHRTLDRSLIFTAGEVRTWIRESEEVVHGLPMTSAPDW